MSQEHIDLEIPNSHSGPNSDAIAELFDALKQGMETAQPNNPVSLPFALRNVLGITTGTIPAEELRHKMHEYRDNLWAQHGFPNLDLLRPGSQNSYYNQLIRTIRDAGIDVETDVQMEVDTPSCQYYDSGEDGENPRIMLNLKHPEIGNNALKAIAALQQVFLIQDSLKRAMGKIEGSVKTPEFIQQTVENTNQNNLINQILMYSTVMSAGSELDPKLIASNVSRTLEAGKYQIISEEATLKKYEGSNMTTQE